MIEPAPMPTVHEAELSWSTVDALFDDLAALAEVREVRLKGGAEGRAAPVAPDLATARTALYAGTTFGVQIRYVHDHVEWCDTLLPGRATVRLVRIATPTLGGEAS